MLFRFVLGVFGWGGDMPEKKASATGRVAAWSSSGRVAWTPRDTGSMTRQGFLGNPVGFRSVKLIAEAAAALPLVRIKSGAMMCILCSA